MNLVASDPQRAASIAREMIGADQRNADAYRLLGAALRRLGEHAAANEAELHAIDASQYDPRLARAGEAMFAGNLDHAEGILREVLDREPDDVAALRMLAEIGIRTGQPGAAEGLLRRAIELAPGFSYAHYTLAVALDMLSRSGEALAHLRYVRGDQANDDQFIGMVALSLSRVGENQEALDLYRRLLERQPGNPEIWISIANLSKIVGDRDAAIEAYRRAIELSPANGEAWWSLANLKTYKFSDQELAAMEAALASPGLSDGDRQRLHFALGKALEDRGEVDPSFDHYQQGNAIAAAQIQRQPNEVDHFVEASKAVFTRKFFEDRSGYGCQTPGPIFIVGMPRSGSTLVEQILAAHPMIVGTAELPDVIVLAREIEDSSPGGARQGWAAYPRVLAELPKEDFERLGELYLARTRIQRKLDRPFFIDKMPNNWMHLGLIRLMLPNAKIIDVRRHPLACGFSNFKQHFARGQEFTYDLRDFGEVYRGYVELTAHFERTLPGYVHRLIYEDLVHDPESQIRKLLDFVGVSFDASCLKHHESKRAVRTASAEQVREPIADTSLHQWKQFEHRLDPLKAALGPALQTWNAPAEPEA